MILYPDVQSRIQQEIDNVVGRDHEVTYADKVNMPFTDATIMEVRRIATPFPVTPPRVSTKYVHKDLYTLFIWSASYPYEMNIGLYLPYRRQ